MTREEAIKILEQRFDASCRNNLFQNAEKLDYEDALWMAISALRSTPQPGKPLTLEQLREMDGQPVWGKSLINEKPGEWFILRVVNMSKTWFIACAGAEQGFGDKDTYGKTWLAYPYPPAHIDRGKWEYCLTCRDLRYLPYEVCAGIKMPGGSEIGASFCPSCGRPLTEEAWAELERRLRG